MIKKGEIGVKDINVLRALMERTYHPLLITINCEVAEEFGIFITDAWRESTHPGDVHATKPGRGMDLRVRVYGTLERAKQIEAWINMRWEYDFRRPEMKVAIIHGEGDNKHLHIQICQNTRRTGLN